MASTGGCGNSTTNSLPRPSPGLEAVTVPPCSATRLRTMARPSPKPPCERSSDCRFCTNRSNTRSSSSGLHPDALVLDADPHASVAQFRGEHDPGLGVAVLGGVRQQVGQHLREARRIGVDHQAPGGNRDVQDLPLPLEDRARQLDGTAGDLGQFDPFLPKFDLPVRDPRDVEQVVDEPHQALDLSLDDVLLARRLILEAHQLQRRQDRRQRIAQLVAEHGQELVLGQRRGLRPHARLFEFPCLAARACTVRSTSARAASSARASSSASRACSRASLSSPRATRSSTARAEHAGQQRHEGPEGVDGLAFSGGPDEDQDDPGAE